MLGLQVGENEQVEWFLMASWNWIKIGLKKILGKKKEKNTIESYVKIKK